jgi:hypothetical protein
LVEDDLPRVVEKGIEEMEESADKKGSHIGARAFKITGIYPYNPNVLTDKHFAPSDAALGLSASHPEVKAIEEMDIEAMKLDFQHELAIENVDNKEIIEKNAKIEAEAKKIDLTRFLQNDLEANKEKAAKEAAKREAEELRLKKAEERKKKADEKAAGAAAAAPISGRKRGRPKKSEGAAAGRGLQTLDDDDDDEDYVPRPTSRRQMALAAKSSSSSSAGAMDEDDE